MFSEDVLSEDIEKMDLFNICEIKRKKGGEIEIKFFDRLKALQMLSELVLGENEDRASGLYKAIEKGALALKGVDEKEDE